MTIRQRTIRIPFAPFVTTPGLATATRHNFAAVTIPIPMTGTRSFLSARVCLTYRTEASMTLTSTVVGIKLGAVAFTDTTNTNTITTTNEDMDRKVEVNVTSYFTANFGAGTTQTAQVGFEFVAASGTITNIMAMLVISFLYDDAHASASTRVRTVPIYLDNPAVVTNALTTVGGANQIPNLDSVLGESSKTYSQIWFEFDGNVCSGATTDFTLSAALDAEGAVLIWNEDATNGSSVHAHAIWVRNDMTTNATHDLKLISSVTNRFAHLRCVLWVTYTYDHAASTRITNHARLPIDYPAVISGDSTRPNRARRVLSIQEPGTITTIRAGVALDWMCHPSTSREPQLRVGAQSLRTFTEVAPTLPISFHSVGHRFDAGATDGAGLTFARGENTIDVDLVQEVGTDDDTTSFLQSVGGYIDVVYTSDKHASGDGVHMTVFDANVLDIVPYSTTTRNRLTTAADVAPVPVATDFCRQATGMEINSLNRGGVTDSHSVVMERLTAEGGPSWDRMGSGARFLVSPGEVSEMTTVVADDRMLSRWPSDPDPNRKLVSSTGRRYMFWHTLSPYNASLNLVSTYHQIKDTIAGTVTGFSGDGSGIVVSVHRADTGEKVATATTAIGGTWTADVYDDVLTYFAQAQQTAALVGRSFNSTP